MNLANAIALQEVKIVIGNVLTEMLQKMDTFEKLMEYINSFEDIARHKENIKALVDVKRVFFLKTFHNNQGFIKC